MNNKGGYTNKNFLLLTILILLIHLMDLHKRGVIAPLSDLFDSLFDVKIILYLILLLLSFLDCIILYKLEKKDNNIILNSINCTLLIFILNIFIQIILLIFSRFSLGYGSEYYIFSSFSKRVYYIFLIGAILYIIQLIISSIRKQKSKYSAIGNGLIIFIALSIIFTPTYSGKYLIHDYTNYTYNKSFVYVNYSSDDTEEYIIDKGCYFYIPIIKKYFIINSNGININSVIKKNKNSIIINEKGKYKVYKISYSDYTAS